MMAAVLAQFRDRLKNARRYLVGRIAEDDDPDRKFPDSGWMRILASLQTCLEAVEAVMAEEGEDGVDAAGPSSPGGAAP